MLGKWVTKTKIPIGGLLKIPLGYMFTAMSTLDSKTRVLIRDPKQRRARIKYQIHMQGRMMADVARDAGVDRRTLYQTFQRPYPRMEKIIAEALGLTPQELFPERYDKNGLPNRMMGRKPNNSTVKAAKNSTATTASHVQSERAVRHGS